MNKRSFFIIVAALIVVFSISSCSFLSPDSEPPSPIATQIPPKSKLPPETKIPEKIQTLISYATVYPFPGPTYWISSYWDPWLGPSEWVPIYNLPGEFLSNPSVAIIDYIPDATLVELIGVKDEYCYVEGFAHSIEGIPDVPFEGWLNCDFLLTYKPTPIPTLNLTPQRP
ncbi:hypothetical protein ES705_31876 [subsurface metagenome]|jgi:hypothetical protein